MDRVTAEQTLEVARRHGCRAMHIGGGEPFLDMDGLCGVLDAAVGIGVGIEYVETNGSWFSGLRSATEKLARLREHGLSTLMVSIDPFHNAVVPLEKIRGVMAACRATGMQVFPWRSEFLPELGAFAPDRPHGLEEYVERHGTGYPRSVFERYGVSIGGRAALTARGLFPRRPVEVILRRPSPCARLAATSHFHLDLHGNYIPTLCTGLTVRRDDVGGVLEDYPLLQGLYAEGVGALVRLATASHGFEPDPAGYVDACDLCLAARMHLVLKAGWTSHELGPRGFYEQLAGEAA
jgi:hypothetical protein